MLKAIWIIMTTVFVCVMASSIKPRTLDQEYDFYCTNLTKGE